MRPLVLHLAAAAVHAGSAGGLVFPLQEVHVKDDDESVGFVDLVQNLGGGAMLRELDTLLQRVTAKLASEAIDQGKTVKGELTLKISFASHENGLLSADYDVKGKEPKPRRPGTMLWQTPEGALSFSSPRQTKIDFGVERPRPAPVLHIHDGSRKED